MTLHHPVYAHTLRGRPSAEWETLDEHAARVSALALRYAEAFGAREWGALLGRWHDLGKGSGEFQRYIQRTADPNAAEDESAPGRVDHSTFGAQHAVRAVGGHAGQILAFCIAGHHGGLPDAVSGDERTRGSTLAARLRKAVPAIQTAWVDDTVPRLRLPFRPEPPNSGFQVAFFARMLYSALIDADRTATEAFCEPETASARSRPKPAITDLRPVLDAFLSQKERAAEPTPVNQVRSAVLAASRAAAEQAPGFFSLNVPTGGGKTFTSLAFALHHAERHALRRVVVAIPFTSIIEQTADEYRKALGALATDAIVEHHSALAPARDTRANKHAAENWDAPLVITTNVQLYESLFADRGTACRKLHRLAHSVIVLDEAQTIPVELLEPTLLALRELVRHYGCSVVLCTATQPALERRLGEFEIGIDNVRPIIKDVPTLFRALRRVEVVQLGRLDDVGLAERIVAEPSALCVVNTRAHAASLYDAVVELCGKQGCFHLSTLMCGQHRRGVLAAVKRRLTAGRPCRLISTQLVEAGVNLDFPTVFRAPAGFDSIAQAAGRCNREGRLQRDGVPTLGRVYLFDSDAPPPPGLLRATAQCGRELLQQYPDPLAPDAVEAYFRLFYWSQAPRWDACEVLGALTDDLRDPTLRLQFRTAAERYRIIREEQHLILVPYGRDARAVLDQLQRGAIDYALQRQMQRYLVGVREPLLHQLADAQVVVPHESGVWLMVNKRAYTRAKGITPGAVGMDPVSLCQ